VEPGGLVAAGRDGAIYEFGPGRVLRKTFDGRSIASEARIMQHVAEHGYPVPRIDEVRANGTEIVMERIDGVPMLDDMVRPPTKLPKAMRTLADLHDQLHAIAAPDWMRDLDDGGECVVHLDLHPQNVLMTASGPVVIDWANACRGHALSDVAATYALLTCARIPLPRLIAAGLAAVRSPLIDRTFAARYRGPAFDARVAAMAALKTLDPNMSPDEITALQTLAAKKERASG
jgi:aminoglycoside phosphotransferase (APT) family kinase protein